MSTFDLIIGNGEIGSALYEVLKPSFHIKIADRNTPITHKARVLYICYPYSKDFVKYTKDYIKGYNPELVVVLSTLPVGTCESINPSIIHSPVEGKHPELASSILSSPRWIGSSDKESLDKIEEIWDTLFVIRRVRSSRFTEFLKLRSTSKYGINIVWTEYEKSVADEIGMDFNLIKDFDNDYNNLYRELGMGEYQRYILNPPNGKIGGHCVVPNAEILDKQFPNNLLKMIVKMR